jgi:hypothetical protein
MARCWTPLASGISRTPAGGDRRGRSIQNTSSRLSRKFKALASVDTHPKDGDVKQAPLVSGAVPSEASADAPPPPGGLNA